MEQVKQVSSTNTIKKFGRRNRKKEILYTAQRIVKIVFRLVFFLGMAYVMLEPIINMVTGAFKGIEDVYDPTVVWIPKHWSLQAMKLAMKSMSFGKSFAQTMIILVPSVILEVISTLVVAYGFARFNFKGRNLLFGLLIFTIIVPTQTYIIPQYVNFTKFLGFIPLIDTPFTFYIPAMFGSGIRSGLYIYIIRQFFRNMPSELEEAAMIDGCGPISTFTRVMVPNIIPAMVTVLVFSIVWYWNDYLLSGMFYNNNFPLSVNLTLIEGMLNTVGKGASSVSDSDLWLLKHSVIQSGCLLTIGPLVVMYIFAQRYFTESIERTGIVG